MNTLYKKITFNVFEENDGVLSEVQYKQIHIIVPAHLDIDKISELMINAETSLRYHMKYRLTVNSVTDVDPSESLDIGYKPKYIVFEGEFDDVGLTGSYPFIFSNEFVHKDVSRRMMRLDQICDHWLELRGAGFISGSLESPHCDDRSESANVDSRAVDVQCIINGGGWTRETIDESDHADSIIDSMSGYKAPKSVVGVVQKSPKGVMQQGKKGKRWS